MNKKGMIIFVVAFILILVYGSIRGMHYVKNVEAVDRKPAVKVYEGLSTMVRMIKVPAGFNTDETRTCYILNNNSIWCEE